jgi:hypothetical protein
MGILVGALVIYLLIGLLLTGFCVHMSYHEAAIGYADNDDLKAQKVLESRVGILALLLLFLFWPLAILIAFNRKPEVTDDQLAPGAEPGPSPLAHALKDST